MFRDRNLDVALRLKGLERFLYLLVEKHCMSAIVKRETEGKSDNFPISDTPAAFLF